VWGSVKNPQIKKFNYYASMKKDQTLRTRIKKKRNKFSYYTELLTEVSISSKLPDLKSQVEMYLLHQKLKNGSE
jgi:hypothetical protein